MKPICGTASMTVSSSTTRSRCKGSGSTGCWGPNGMTVAFPMLLTFLFCFRLRRFARALASKAAFTLAAFSGSRFAIFSSAAACFAASLLLGLRGDGRLDAGDLLGIHAGQARVQIIGARSLMTSPVGLDFASGWLATYEASAPSQRAPWRLSPRPPSSPSREPPSAPAR